MHNIPALPELVCVYIKTIVGRNNYPDISTRNQNSFMLVQKSRKIEHFLDNIKRTLNT